MSITIPGFPTEVTKEIETPDISELLMYPIFMVAPAETVIKYGTDFQKKLLDSAPIKNNCKNVTVYSSVHLMHPLIRPITNFPDRNIPGEEWHIDGSEGGNDYEHITPVETVHLFMAHADARTRFLEKEMSFDSPNLKGLNRLDFCSILNNRHNDRLMGGGTPLLNGKMIDKNKIYTFSNHFHTITIPDRLEFRFTFRIRETNREDIPPLELQMQDRNRFTDSSNSFNSNILLNYDYNKVEISYPPGLWNYHHKK